MMRSPISKAWTRSRRKPGVGSFGCFVRCRRQELSGALLLTWLALADGSDRTIAALISCPMLLSDEDIFVSEPLEVDDSLITAAGSFQQPRGRTPVISGFVHVTRIFRLLSRVLRLVRQRARAQAVDANTDSFPDPRTLIHSLQSLLDDLPPPLRLQSDVHEPRNQVDSNAFETCKANLLVNQVLVRFAIYQYAMLRSAGRPEQYLDELTEDVLKTLHKWVDMRCIQRLADLTSCAIATACRASPWLPTENLSAERFSLSRRPCSTSIRRIMLGMIMLRTFSMW